MFQASFTSWFPALNGHCIEKAKVEKGEPSATFDMDVWPSVTLSCSHRLVITHRRLDGFVFSFIDV